MEQATDHIEHEGREIAFHIRYSARRRKSITIRIDRHGAVICAAPKRTPRSRIIELMKRRSDWITRHLAQFEARASALPPLQYAHGERHFYMGRALPLAIDRGTSRRASIQKEEGCIRIVSNDTNTEKIRAILLKWYRRQAHQIFLERMRTVIARIPWLEDGKMPELRIRAMKSRWGSCSVHGVITLNLHLIKAPIEQLDYVIAHELCHLREHNHGPRFYALLEEQMPEWRSLKRALEEMPEILR